MSSKGQLCGSPQGEGLVILFLPSCCSKRSVKSSMRLSISNSCICWLKKEVFARHYGERVKPREHHNVQY